MKIAWIQQSTMVDYPGKIACVVFTQWCNFLVVTFVIILNVYCRKRWCCFKTIYFWRSIFQFFESEKMIAWRREYLWWRTYTTTRLVWLCQENKRDVISSQVGYQRERLADRQKNDSDKIFDYIAVDLKHSLHCYEDAIGIAQPAEFYQSYQNYRYYWKAK